MTIDWKAKLTSRKLWVSIAAFVGMMIVFVGGSTGESEKVVSLIMAGAMAISYVVGEGLVDANKALPPQ